MINVFRISHFAWELRTPEVREAFKQDPEGEMTRHHLSEEDREPIRTKNMQIFLDLGINSNILGTLCQALDLPRIILAPRAARRPIFDTDLAELTPEELEWREKVEKIQTELKLMDRN